MGRQSHTQVASVNLPLRFLQAYLEAQDLETLIQPQFWKDSRGTWTEAIVGHARLVQNSWDLEIWRATVQSWRFCRQFFSFTLAEFCNEVEEGTRTTTACQCFACSTMRHVTYSRFRCPDFWMKKRATEQGIGLLPNQLRWFAPGSWKAVFQCPEGQDVQAISKVHKHVLLCTLTVLWCA